MYFNKNSFSRILHGIGLGVLLFSCLTVTICFSQYANSFSSLAKLQMKISFDYRSSVYDSSISIAVLGCLGFVGSLFTLVLIIILDSQPLFILISCGVTSILTLGCIISEGLFTQKIVNNNAYSEDLLQEYSHKKAQEYIKNSIKELYQQAEKNIKMPSSNHDLNPLSWSSVESSLGKKIGDSNNIFTYSSNRITPIPTNSFPIKYISMSTATSSLVPWKKRQKMA